MEQSNVFSYQYSAKQNREVEHIRRKYLPQEENKMETLRKLDARVQMAGTIPSLCIGVVGALVFGLGMCLAMQVIGTGTAMMALGIVIGIIGFAGCGINYPIYKKLLEKGKAKYAFEIVELARQISEQ